MKLAMGQIDSTSDKTENLLKIRSATAKAGAEGADLVVFPEFAMFENVRLDDSFVEASEPVDGPFCAGLAQLASDYGLTIVAGVLESVPGERRASNTLVVFGPDGALVTVYRKVHLYDAFGDRESDIIRPGEEVDAVPFDTAGTTVGLMTCYDLRFPESARQLADAGVELALLPASWTPGPRKEDHWEVLTRARAIENTFYLASVCQAPPISTGGSLLVDPMGIKVGELGETVGVGIYDVDPERVAQVRAKNPCLANRRFAVVPREAALLPA